MSRLLRSSPIVAVLVALLLGAGLLGVRSLGMLESLELGAYDWYLRIRPDGPPLVPRVALVTVTERDIHGHGGWPLSDRVLADALERVGRLGARAIGLDIYRDVAVPPGSDKLQAVLAGDPRIVVVTKFAGGTSQGVPPPLVLKGTDQVGFNDVIVDPGGVVRRGLLFLDDGQTVVSSFALQLALRFLAAEGVGPQPDPHDQNLLRLGRTTIRPLEPNDGGYVGTDARGYQFMLDFAGARRPFPSVDLTALLAGQVEPDALRDKVVLIGVTAESIKDNFYTPFSRGGLEGDQDVSGVAVHAHVVSQLLRMGLDGARPMASLAEWQEAAVILLSSAAGALIGLRVRSPWHLAPAVGGGVLGLGLLDFVAFLGGWWIPLVPPAMAWLVAAGSVTAWLSYQETAQRATLMRLFSRHVSKEVAETIWQQREQFLDGGHPRSERLVVTALFTDLTGYTTVAERMAPEALMEWLNEYMDAMARQVSRHGGVIRQYAGDSVVVVFGVPVGRRSETEIAQDAVNAVECALGMEAALRELNRRWVTEQRPTTGMRIGILTGPVVAGTLGSVERSEYVVVGDTVNTAARLEQFDKELLPPDPETRPCRILIGETTLAHLGDRFETQRVGDVSLKGKEQRVGVYWVVGRRHPAVPVPAQEDDDESRQAGRGDLDFGRRRDDSRKGGIGGAATRSGATERGIPDAGGRDGGGRRL
jgi:adenylate cyclase